jgi:WD40 repeat protein
MTSPTAGNGNDQIRLWQLADPAHPTFEDFLPSLGVDFPKQISITPSGTALVLSNSMGEDAELWDITYLSHPKKTGSLSVIAKHQTVTYHPSGDVVATYSGADPVIRLWRVTDPANTRQIGQPLVGHDADVGSLAYSPNGRLLASAGFMSSELNAPLKGGEVRLWNFNLEENVRHLCDTTTKITDDQRRRYIPNLDYEPPCS